MPRLCCVPNCKGNYDDCSLYFAETDIQTYQGILSSNGVLENVLSRCPRLIEDAVPSVFPNSPSYLTKPVLPQRKDPVEPRERIIKNHKSLVREFIDSDLISDFLNLINNYEEKLVISNHWSIKLTNSKIYFCMLNQLNLLILNILK
ncbi:hypothetical protein ANTPLA_LOCUS7622 [Anthophora plagiata]